MKASSTTPDQARLKKRQQRLQNIEIRINQVLSDPLAEYAKWVIKMVAEDRNITIEQIKSHSRIQTILEARYYAIKIISINTYFKEYSIIFFGRNRSVYYNSIEDIEEILKHEWKMNVFKTLAAKCTLEEFNKSKDKKEEGNEVS